MSVFHIESVKLSSFNEVRVHVSQWQAQKCQTEPDSCI